MGSRNVIETIMGAVVLLVAASFIFIAYKSGNVKNMSGYQVEARFEQVGGIAVGSDVRIGGVKVGTVSDLKLDTENGLYQAVLAFSIDKSIKLPEDTSAAIVSDGLLGGKYVALEPGGMEEYLEPGDVIETTQSSINLESMIGKFIFGAAKNDKDKETEEE